MTRLDVFRTGTRAGDLRRRAARLVTLLGAAAALCFCFADVAPAQTRFLDEVFASVQTSDAIPYGSTTSRCGGYVPQEQTHLLTVHEPQGDTLVQRPLVVVIPGGGFVAESRNNADMVTLAQKLARRGYVAAVIDYRVCPELAPYTGTEPVLAAIVREAQQDALAAVRFFRAKSTRWHVDPSRIMLAGFSAGAVTGLTAAFDPEAEPLTNDCCQNQPANVCAVASVAGSTDANLIAAGDPPTLLIHHVADAVVPVASSQAVEARCNAVGVPVEAHYLNMPLAEPHYGIFTQVDAIVGWMAAHFYNHVVLGPGCGERRGVLVESEFSDRIPDDWIRYATAAQAQLSIVNDAARFTVFQNAATCCYVDAEINDWMTPMFQTVPRMPWRFVNIDFRLRTSNVNPCSAQGLSGTGVGTRGWGFWDGSINNFLWFLSVSDPSATCIWGAASARNGAGYSTTNLSTDMTQWHDYRIVWRPTDAEFYVDGTFVSTVAPPTVPMGLVFWIDNGSPPPPFLALNEDQFVEVDRIRVYTSRARFTNDSGVDQESYASGNQITVTLDDPDENLDRLLPETAQVVVSSATSGDSETLALTETANASGEFRGGLPLVAGSASPGDGSLQAQPGERLELHYVDPDDPSDTDVDTAFVSFSDDFSLPRSSFWGYLIGGRGPSVGTAGGQLRITIPASSSTWGNGIPLNAGFLSSCTLTGDFDVQADYELTTPPVSSGGVSILAWPAVISAPISLGGVSRVIQPNLYQVSSPPAHVATVATTDTTGKLRLRRSGSTAIGYYDGGSGWGAIGAPIPMSSAEARLSLHFSESAATGQAAEVRFDNFVINSGNVSCPLNQMCGNGVVEGQFSESCDDGNSTPGDGCCACRAEPLTPPDVSGSWQLNVSCGASATTMQTVSMTQPAGSSTATVTVTRCGTFFGSDGQIHSIASCDLSGSYPAQVCGTVFAHSPPPGTSQFASPFAPPAGSLGACANLERVVSQVRLNGEIAKDALNRAVQVQGSQYLDSASFFDATQTQACLELAGSFCDFDLRRNSAGPGRVSLEPLAGVSVTLAQAYSQVEILVVPETSASASLPPNFQLAPNVSGAPYLNITPIGSYAAGLGAVTVCIGYRDDDGDGVVDGTTLAEGSLEVLHLEGGAFVKRTSSHDPVRNRVCATVTSFSPFVLGAGDAPTPTSLCAPLPRNDCRGPGFVNASRIVMKPSARVPLVWRWRGQGDESEFGDPLDATDYQVCLYDRIAGAPIPVTAATADAAGTCGTKPCWRTITRGFKYRNRAATPDGFLSLTLKRTRSGEVKFVAKGKRALLVTPPLPLRKESAVTAQLVNSQGMCWTADFSTPLRNDTRVFKARSD